MESGVEVEIEKESGKGKGKEIELESERERERGIDEGRVENIPKLIASEKKLGAWAFYDWLGRPKHILGPMVSKLINFYFILDDSKGLRLIKVSSLFG